MCRLPSASVPLLLVFALVAQEPPRPPKVGEQAPQKGGVAEQKAAESEGDALADGGGKQPNPNAVVYGARGYCRIDATVEPSRLLPGQTGRALVTMMLEGDAVMTAPANIEVAPMGGGMTFGPAVATPPERGRLAKAFLGQLVYDNWIVLEMPVTMSAQAQLGSKQTAAVGLTFELVSGTTAQRVGKFNERATFNVEVGRAPDPSVSIPAAQPEAAAGQPDAPASGQDGNDRRGAGDGDTVRPSLEGAVGEKVPENGVAPSAPGTDHAQGVAVGQRPEGSNHLLLFGGGAVLLLILVAALLRRR
jgi:hypothetical protein